MRITSGTVERLYRFCLGRKDQFHPPNLWCPRGLAISEPGCLRSIAEWKLLTQSVLQVLGPEQPEKGTSGGRPTGNSCRFSYQ